MIKLWTLLHWKQMRWGKKIQLILLRRLKVIGTPVTNVPKQLFQEEDLKHIKCNQDSFWYPYHHCDYNENHWKIMNNV